MRVLVVGGGAAGWITAAYINATMNNRNAGRKNIAITVVESASIGRIGVGEATVPTLKNTLRDLRIDKSTFMRATDATFKQAIKFVNWGQRSDHEYFHPFERIQYAGKDNSGLIWLTQGQKTPFAYTVSPQPALCDAFRGPKQDGDADYRAAVQYAYHLDAEKFADYLAEFAMSDGVERLLDDVVGVEKTADDLIVSVQTRSGRKLEADLFIDCTGFARLLISKAQKSEFVDYAQWLLCDRALAMRVPYETFRPDRIKPFTTATALSSGWVWDIALKNRRGVGYVYSSGYIDDDAAESELRRFEGTHCKDLACRPIRFQAGRVATPWRGNCIAVGLAAGFLEPLESTGIYFIEYGARMICEHFPLFGRFKACEKQFNRLMANRYEEVVDFINLHYCLSKRTDTEFWKEVQKKERITDSLKNRLNIWNEKLVSPSDFANNQQLFGYQNFEQCLYGMNWSPAKLKNVKMKSDTTSNYLNVKTREFLNQMPLHDSMVEKIH